MYTHILLFFYIDTMDTEFKMVVNIPRDEFIKLKIKVYVTVY